MGRRGSGRRRQSRDEPEARRYPRVQSSDAPAFRTGASPHSPGGLSRSAGREGMDTTHSYKARHWNLAGLKGISDKTLETHFKLYEGYVTETNRLTGQLAEMLRDGHVDHEEMPAYSEVTRRLGFEYNGMVLHEYYFDNMKKGGTGDPKNTSSFYKACEHSYGSYRVWKEDFIGVGKMRGVGWAICYGNPANGFLSNHWITLHEVGNVSGFVPILVMDVWEHAFLLDYKPAERPKYIESFFSNVDWNTVEHRTQTPSAQKAQRAQAV